MPPSSRSPQPAKAVLSLRDIHQATAARELGVSAHYLGRVLNGREKPSDEFKTKLADYLDVDAQALFPDDLADVVVQLVRRTTAASNVAEVVEDPAAIEQVVAVLRNGVA